MGDTFRSTLDEFQSRLERPRISTGSAELDRLIGGIELGQFYLFFDNEELGITDIILHILIVNCLKPRSQGGFGGKALYLNCGNYKRTKTRFYIELITSYTEAAGLDVPTSLDQIYTLSAFSEHQQIKAVSALTGPYIGLVVLPFEKLKHLCRYEKGRYCRMMRGRCNPHNCPQIIK